MERAQWARAAGSFVRGGMGAITQAIARSGKEKGLVCKTDCEVAGIGLGESAARPASPSLTGCATEGQEFVASNDLGEAHLPQVPPTSRSCRRSSFATLRRTGRFRLRSRSTSPARRCRNTLPSLTQRRAASPIRPIRISGRRSTISNGPMTTRNTATCRAEPFVTPVTPTFVDDSVAPPGKHIVNLFGGHAPYTLKTGDWATRRG